LAATPVPMIADRFGAIKFMRLSTYSNICHWRVMESKICSWLCLDPLFSCCPSSDPTHTRPSQSWIFNCSAYLQMKRDTQQLR
jgi:hypothetical protein